MTVAGSESVTVPDLRRENGERAAGLIVEALEQVECLENDSPKVRKARIGDVILHLRALAKIVDAELVQREPCPLRPTAGYCFVDRLPKSALRAPSGIEMPDDMEGCPDYGVVVACGPRERHALTSMIAEGDRVFYSGVMGTEVLQATADYPVLVRVAYDDILAIQK